MSKYFIRKIKVGSTGGRAGYRQKGGELCLMFEYVHWSNYAEVATCDSKHRIRHVSSRVTGVSHVPQCHLIHKADPQLRAGKATIRFTSESLNLHWVGLDVPLFHIQLLISIYLGCWGIHELEHGGIRCGPYLLDTTWESRSGGWNFVRGKRGSIIPIANLHDI